MDMDSPATALHAGAAEMRPVALITGASSGIGAALAHVFAQNGHEVVLAARRERQLAAIAQRIHAAGHRTPHRSEEHTSELQSRPHLVCRLLLEKKKTL